MESQTSPTFSRVISGKWQGTARIGSNEVIALKSHHVGPDLDVFTQLTDKLPLESIRILDFMVLECHTFRVDLEKSHTA